MRSLALALVLLWSAAAGAVPRTINFTGRLTTSAGPVNGAVNVTLRLFADASGGNPVWSEVHNNVGADNGLVFIDVGSQTTLDDTVLDGRRLYLEIVVGDETLAPRLALNSVPYAVRTDTAASADRLGSFTPNEVVTSINPTAGGGISITRDHNTVSVGLTTTSCQNGQVFKVSGGVVGCADDAVGNFTAGNGLAISGGSISLKACAANQIYKMNAAATAFTCQADDNTTLTGTAPISVSNGAISLVASAASCPSGTVLKSNGSTFTCQADATGPTLSGGNGIAIASSVVSLATTGCGNNQVYKFNSTTSSFSCQNDAGITSATAPLVVSGGTTVSLPTTCSANQVLRWNASTSTWVCSSAFAAASCTWAVATPQGAATNLLAGCGTRRPISGGCLAGSGAVTETRPASITTNGDAVTAATGWFCAFNSSSAGHFAFALCCDAT
jgi:hypothetical protein